MEVLKKESAEWDYLNEVGPDVLEYANMVKGRIGTEMIHNKMKAYRIKHKASGLYYQPTSNGNNLSKTGKVYLTKNNVLNGTDTFIFITLKETGKLYKEFGKFFPTLKPYHVYMTGRVAKTEFEKEEL